MGGKETAEEGRWPDLESLHRRNKRPLEKYGGIRRYQENVPVSVLSRIEAQIGMSKKVMEEAEEWIWVVRGETANVHYTNGRCSLLGIAREDLMGKSIFDFIDEELRPQLERMYKEAYEKRETIAVTYPMIDRVNGKTEWWELSARPLIDAKIMLGYAGINRKVTDRVKLEKEKEYAATHDPLTGANNRLYWEERLTLMLKRNLPFSIVIVDVDGMKRWNDDYGHAAGDFVLKETVRGIMHCTRVGRIKEGEFVDVVARIGGDEFVILLSDADEGEAEEIGDRIVRYFRNRERDLGNPIDVPFTVSVGASRISRKEVYEQALKDADKLIYLMKFDNPYYRSVVLNYVKMLELRGSSTRIKKETIVKEVKKLVKLLGVDRIQTSRVLRGSLLYDLGMLVMPDVLLGQEWEEMNPIDKKLYKKSFQYADGIMSPIPVLNDCKAIPLLWQARWDGKGIPRTLKGTNIPLEVRIFRVVYEYQKKLDSTMSRQQALDYIEEISGSILDPAIVKVFVVSKQRHS